MHLPGPRAASAVAGLHGQARAEAAGLADELAHAQAGQVARGRAPALPLRRVGAPAPAQTISACAAEILSTVCTAIVSWQRC